MKKAAFWSILALLLALRVSAREQGSIQLQIRCETRPVSGAQVILYQVGQRSETGELSLTKEFEGISADGELWTEPAFAQELWRSAQEKRLPGMCATTDETGAALFQSLEEGVYLLGQTNMAEGYRTFLPFLVQLPMETAGQICWTVVAKPKVTLDESPKTADSLGTFCRDMGALLTGASVWYVRKKRK